MPKTPALTPSVGANVRAELKRRGVTQGDAAVELDLSRNAFTDRLSGRVDFRHTELQRLALLLGVSYGRLIEGTDTPKDAA